MRVQQLSVVDEQVWSRGGCLGVTGLDVSVTDDMKVEKGMGDEKWYSCIEVTAIHMTHNLTINVSHTLSSLPQSLIHSTEV